MLYVSNIKLEINNNGDGLDEKKHRRPQGIIGGCMGGIVAVVIALRNLIGIASAVILAVTAIVGTALSYLCRRKVTEVIEDENPQDRRGGFLDGSTNRAVDDRSWRSSPSGLRQCGYSELTIAGYTLCFLCCFLLIIYFAFWNYFSKKM